VSAVNEEVESARDHGAVHAAQLDRVAPKDRFSDSRVTLDRQDDNAVPTICYEAFQVGEFVLTPDDALVHAIAYPSIARHRRPVDPHLTA
jgi:hypothetical protein